MNKEYLVTASEMQEYDRDTIENIKINQLVLMERAANAVAMHVYQYILRNGNQGTVLTVAGNGNNGADAIACARILKEYSVDVEILCLSDMENLNGPIKVQMDIANKYKIPIYFELPEKEYDIIIDGIFGIGLNRTIAGRYFEIITKLNEKQAYKFSIDIPSGIDATSGNVLGTAFKANETITFGFMKRGLFLGNGREYAGIIHKEKIGINELSFHGTKPKMFTYYDSVLGIDSRMEYSLRIDLDRNPKGNKGTFGKVLIIAGRNDMGGASILAAKSALKSGCGMVSVFTEDGNRDALLKTIPEAMVHTYHSKQMISEKITNLIDWCDCLAIGPGIGRDDKAKFLVEEVINQCDKPIIFDADALYILASDENIYHKLQEMQKNMDTRKILVFTPHLKEFSDLVHVDMEHIIKERLEISKRFAENMNAILVLKDFQTICCLEGKDFYLNLTGNDVLAKAGSGDVLTGLIVSLIAQYIKKNGNNEDYLFFASCLAVYIHGIAGELASKKWNHSSCLASEIIDEYYTIIE